jgi:5-methylcytosine-specific restriction endonuclease McrA
MIADHQLRIAPDGSTCVLIQTDDWRHAEPRRITRAADNSATITARVGPNSEVSASMPGGQQVALRTELDTRAWKQLSKRILARDRHTCQIRGPHCTGVATTTDHITPRIYGGDMWDPANLRAACRPCNAEGGGRITRARRQRYAQRIPT